jgi:hypothetical protein
MATRYTATLKVSCEKEHTCVGCGAKFSYTLGRTIKGEGGSPEKATAAAQKKAVKAVADDVDLQPCPTCGIYQPDMLGSRRAVRHLVLFWGAAVMLFVLLVLHWADLVRDDRVAWLAAGVIGIVAVIHWQIDSHDPNRNREANRRLVADRVDAGVLRLVEPGRPVMPEEPAWQPQRSLGYPLTLGLMIVAAVLALLPELARRSAGWPLNDGWYPPVAGPGDETYLYLPESVHSIQGMWQGTATVTAEDADLHLPAAAEFNIRASTKSSDWGQSIHVKSSEKDSRSRLWVRLHLPPDAQHAGHTIDCRIQLSVRYPQVRGDSRFEDQHSTFSHTARLMLAAPEAGNQYEGLWWGGVLGGGGLLLAMSLVRFRLARALQRQSLPTRILVPGK